MKLPSLEAVIAFNASVRSSDEWFHDPDELIRVESILHHLAELSDPVEAAAIAASRISTAQAFTEGNKRTALAVARWILDHNEMDGLRIMPTVDDELAQLLLRGARGSNVQEEVVRLFQSRR